MNEYDETKYMEQAEKDILLSKAKVKLETIAMAERRVEEATEALCKRKELLNEIKNKDLRDFDTEIREGINSYR